MTNGAIGIGAMLFHAFAQGAGELFAFFEFGHIGRRRRWRGAQKVFEDPFAAFDGRGAGGVGGNCEDAALREQAAARSAFE